MINKDTSRREFLKTAGAGALGLSMFGCQTVIPADQNHQRPNIIVIMADDMGFSDLNCYGSDISTPNINSLADNGLRFTQFYNAARCCPTRASLLTGLYPHQAGIGWMAYRTNEGIPGPYQGFLNNDCVTIAEVLGKAGYKTVMSGKWHVGEFRPVWPVDRGFDHYFGLISGAANYFDITRPKDPWLKNIMALDGREYHPPKEGFYMTDAISDHAAEFVRDHDFNHQPLFMYVAYTAPHWPLQAWPNDIAKYRGRYKKGWDTLRQQRYERMVQMGIINANHPLSPRDPIVPAWNTLTAKRHDEMDQKMAIYAAQIDRMDQGIGKIFDQVKKKEQWDNTLILLLSDNGACDEIGVFGIDWWKKGGKPGTVDSFLTYGKAWANASNTPLRLYKKRIHEGGISTPLIAHWPAQIKVKGELTHQTGHVIDIMATCCDIGQASYPKHFKKCKIHPIEGKSLLPIFQGRRREPHDHLAWQHFGEIRQTIGNRGIRCGDWKLVSVDRGQWELYNIAEDRTECNNLAERYNDRVKELIGYYNIWANRVGI